MAATQTTTIRLTSAAKRRITAAARNEDVAARAWRPDPEVMVKARHVQAGGRILNDYDTGVAVSLPWANNDKYRSGTSNS